MDNLTKLKKLKSFLDNKDLASFEVQMELADAMQQFKANTITVKGEKGDKGDPGYTPIKGIDYFDGKDGKDGKSIVGPKGDRGPMGPKGEKGDKGDAGKDGKDAIINEDEIVKKILKQIPEPKMGFMPPIPPPSLKIKGAGTQIADAIREINFAGAGVVVSRDGAEKVLVTIAGGAGVNFADNEVVAGDVQTFTLANTPVLGSEKIYANGQRLAPTTDYTISGNVLTMVNSWPAGTITADYRY
jgi:hypothetical protein